MIPAEFEYRVAESVADAIELLGRNDEAKVLAGGHSLIPAMRLRLARPEVVVDIGMIPGLRHVREDGDDLAIGALTRHADLVVDPLLRRHCPVLCEATALVADRQVRHRGTIGGAAAHGDPSSDQAAVLTALDAEFVICGTDGQRTVAAADFFRGWFATALGQQDILTEIRVPKGSIGAYQKFSRRSHDWATVAVAAVSLADQTRVALASMGSTPLRASGVEEALAAGHSTDAAALRADENTNPASDISGSADYRRQLARVLTRRALEQLA